MAITSPFASPQTPRKRPGRSPLLAPVPPTPTNAGMQRSRFATPMQGGVLSNQPYRTDWMMPQGLRDPAVDQLAMWGDSGVMQRTGFAPFDQPPKLSGPQMPSNANYGSERYGPQMPANANYGGYSGDSMAGILAGVPDAPIPPPPPPPPPPTQWVPTPGYFPPQPGGPSVLSEPAFMQQPGSGIPYNAPPTLPPKPAPPAPAPQGPPAWVPQTPFPNDAIVSMSPEVYGPQQRLSAGQVRKAPVPQQRYPFGLGMYGDVPSPGIAGVGEPEGAPQFGDWGTGVQANPNGISFPNHAGARLAARRMDQLPTAPQFEQFPGQQPAAGQPSMGTMLSYGAAPQAPLPTDQPSTPESRQMAATSSLANAYGRSPEEMGAYQQGGFADTGVMSQPQFAAPAAPYVPNAADFPDPYANATAIPSRPQLPGGAGYSANIGARQTNQRGQQQAMDQMVSAQQGAAENGFSPQVEAQYAQPVTQGEADFWNSPEGQRRALTRTQNANNLLAMQPAGTRQMVGGASGSQFNTPEEWVAAGMPQSEGWTPESRLGLARSGMTTQQFQRELERDPQMRMAAFADAARQRELQAQQQEQDLASRAAWATQRMQERQAARASATPEQQRAAYMAQAPRVQQVDGKWQTEGRLGTTGDATKFAAHQQRQKEVRQQRGAGSIPDMDVRKEMLLAKRQGRQISPFEAGINVKVQRGEDLSDNEKLMAFGPGAMPLTQAAQQASAQTTAANVLSSLIEGGVPMVDPKTGMWNPMIGTLLSMAYPNANFMPFPNQPAPEAQPDKPPPKPEPPSPGDLAYSRTLTRPGGRTKPKGPPTVPWTGTAF